MKEYLVKIANEIYIENISEASSIPNVNDLISETNLEDHDIIIEQKESKTSTYCIIVDKIDRCIKKYENLKKFLNIIAAL